MIYHILFLLQSAWHQRALYMCMWPSTASSVIMVVEFLCCFRDTSVFILLHLWNSVIHSSLTGVFSSLEVLKIMVCLVFDGWNAIFLKFLTIPVKTCIHERRQHRKTAHWPIQQQGVNVELGQSANASSLYAQWLRPVECEQIRNSQWISRG